MVQIVELLEVKRNQAKTTVRGLKDKIFSNYLERPIPLVPLPVDGWKEVPIRESNQPLVPLVGPHANYSFMSDAMYFGERRTSPYGLADLDESLITPFLRLEAAERLEQAQAALPPGHFFLIWDTYRPVAVQKALFDQHIGKLAAKRPDLVGEALEKEAQNSVSLPSKDASKPSPHSTGGVVDLTIAKVPIDLWKNYWQARDGSEKNRGVLWADDARWADDISLFGSELLIEQSEVLDMGTPFDYTGPESVTNFYEMLSAERPLTVQEVEIRRNRRLLYNALIDVGFVNFETEWWHYSFGDQMWGKKVGRPAIYGRVVFTDENKEFESWHKHFFLDGNISRDLNHPEGVAI